MLKYGDLCHFESVQGGNSFSTAKVTLQGDSEKEDTKLKGKKKILRKWYVVSNSMLLT